MKIRRHNCRWKETGHHHWKSLRLWSHIFSWELLQLLQIRLKSYEKTCIFQETVCQTKIHHNLCYFLTWTMLYFKSFSSIIRSTLNLENLLDHKYGLFLFYNSCNHQNYEFTNTFRQQKFLYMFDNFFSQLLNSRNRPAQEKPNNKVSLSMVTLALVLYY